VWFRKYTQKEAVELGLVGWVRNTDTGTVEGVAQGEKDKIDPFKYWLQYKGSPHSRIDKANFKLSEIVRLEFEDFSVKP
ncbi:2201_t:CDS:2, partial [Paraglomus brasilianum]